MSVKLDTTIDVAESPEVYSPSDDSFLLLKVVEVEEGQRLLDMGCGTGLIGLHAAKMGAVVTASDINPHALDCVRRSAAKNNLKVEVVRSDLFENIVGEFDVICFNPPYLPGKNSSTSWIERSWSGGDEGSETSLRFLGQAWRHLAPGGRIYMIASSLGGLRSILKASRDRYDAEMLEEKHMFFESIYAYRFVLKKSSVP